MHSIIDADRIHEIARGFLDMTLPAASFHHREHCVLTAFLVRERPHWDLRRELPPRIRAFNEAAGGRNTADAGYHETLTLFHLGAIEQFMARASKDLAEACNALLSSPIADNDHVLTFYSRELLFSRRARAVWVDPDLKPLPTPGCPPSRPSISTTS